MTDAVSFEDLVTAATVGLARRPLAIGALEAPASGHCGVLDRDDPAAALLDAVALLDAGRRAGVRPARGVDCPAPAGEEQAPELSAKAARLLGQVAATDAGTLGDLLAAAASAGYRAPAPLLPALLDAAARAKALRPAIAGIAGTRGRWLAAQRPQWRNLADAPAPAPASAGAGDRGTAAGEEAAPSLPPPASPGAGAGIADGDTAAAFAELASFPGPWPDVAADAFVAMLRRTAGPAPRPGWLRELTVAAARKLPATGAGGADYAATLTALADTPGCPAPWAAALRRTAQTVALRRAFYEEIR